LLSGIEGTSSTGKVVEEAAAGAADETCSKSKLLSTERKAISGREEHARCRQKCGALLHPQKDDKMVCTSALGTYYFMCFFFTWLLFLFKGLCLSVVFLFPIFCMIIDVNLAKINKNFRGTNKSLPQILGIFFQNFKWLHF
jgi:hypothetical protein